MITVTVYQRMNPNSTYLILNLFYILFKNIELSFTFMYKFMNLLANSFKIDFELNYYLLIFLMLDDYIF